MALKIVPVLAGSAFKNKGIQPLLDAVVDYLPSPLDVPPVEGVDRPTTKWPCAAPATISRFAALAFKIMSDPFVGHVTYIRVYSGVLKSGSYVLQLRQESRANASAACCRCMPTSAKKLTKFMPAILRLAWA